MMLTQLIVGIALHLLQAAATKSSISPSYLWPLRFIYNKKVPVVPPLDIHGDVTNDDVGLRFDGKTAWLDAGELAGSCVAQPEKCISGLSVAMRAKISGSNTTNETTPQFLFDSGGFNGEGVSLYLKGEEIVSEVADKKKFWRASSKLQREKWHFILVTWSPQDGLLMFIDGPIKAQNVQPMSFQLNPVATSNHVILGRCNAEMGTTFAKFSSDLVAVFDSVTPDGKVYLSYSFSAPSTRGNIRYVNAKFINKADFDLTIFPDRGEHQKEGYQLEAHSSTLLEYVLREGPLPIGMNFRLQNKKNGEQLKINEKYDFHVMSSDDKQVVKEYRILPDSKILALTSTSAVNINYQIRPATVNIVQQPPGGGSTPAVGAEALQKEEQNELIDNPEVPSEEENAGNGTQQTQKPKEAPVKGTNATRNGAPLKTTVAPTVPPPPQYTTAKPNTTQPTITNVTTTLKPGSKEEDTITSPELPDDEEKISLQEAKANATNANATDTDDLIDAIEREQNGTTVAGRNMTSNNGTNKEEETITSPELPDDEEKISLQEASANATSANITDKGILEEIGTGNNGTSKPNVTEIGKEPEISSEQFPGQSVVANVRPKNERKPAIVNVDTVNPWLKTAKEVQAQEPIKWQNGKGVFNAIHDMQNGNGIAPVNYNKGKEGSFGERPVWQYLNGEQDITQLLGQNKFRNVEQNQVNTSPFKFANTKTQQEITSYYTQDKDNESQNKQINQLKSNT